MKTLRILVADDHRLMLAAVRRALSGDGLEIVAEVSVGSRVVPAVREAKPDVVLLDLRMPELDGLSCLERLQKQHPDVAVIILSSYSDAGQIEAARQAGARGYVVKTIEPVDLEAVIREALASETFALWGVAKPSLTAGATPAGLSEREAAVLEAVSRGLSNKEIGRQLWISEQTVKFHLRNVYRKLGITSRTEAARYAYRNGLATTLATEG